MAGAGKGHSDLERLGTVAIVGVGLIGGSIGMALRARKLAGQVIGIGRDRGRLARAVELGAVDVAKIDLSEGVNEADVVVVCTPVTRIAADVLAAAKSAPEGVLITDAGSTKRGIVEAVERDPRGCASFVGGHPIAGSEKKGVEYAHARLFEDRACVLTPTARTPADRLQRARRFWEALGCRMFEHLPAEHDERLAMTSHMPHAVAAALAGAVPVDYLPVAAGAYRDMTRVAGSDASLWTAIFRENRQSVVRAIAAFRESLAEIEAALTRDDDAAIIAWWEAAQARKTAFDRLDPTRAAES